MPEQQKAPPHNRCWCGATIDAGARAYYMHQRNEGRRRINELWGNDRCHLEQVRNNQVRHNDEKWALWWRWHNYTHQTYDALLHCDVLQRGAPVPQLFGAPNPNRNEVPVPLNDTWQI